MLVKKELLSVPVLPVPVLPKKKGVRQSDYIPAAQIVELPKSGKILAVDYYHQEALFCRFFCDGKNSIVYSAEKKVWRSGYPLPGGYYGADVAAVEATDTVCNSFFGTGSWRSGIRLVNAFVGEQASNKREIAQHNLNELMKRHMAMFPAYPDNLREYCSEQVFQHDYIFFGKKEKNGTREARCGHCGAHFTLDKGVTSGTGTTCPRCHTKAVYRANWIKADVSDNADICFAYKVDGQLLLKWAHVQRSYCFPEFKQSYRFDDFFYSLYLTVNGNQNIYSYKWFTAPYAYEAMWHRLPIGSTCDSSSYIYTDNLDEVFGTSYYNVNLKADLEGKHLRLQFVHLLDELKNSPKAEFLFKMGLPMLAISAYRITGDPDGQGVFQKQVGVSKQYLPMLRSLNVTASELSFIKNSGEWVSPELFQIYRSVQSRCRYNNSSLEEVIAEVGVSKALRYIGKQQQLYPKVALSKILVEYKDYLHMSKELRVDMSHKSVRFPADIVEAHRTITARYNEVMGEIQKRKGEELNAAFHEAVQEHYARMDLTGFQKDGFCVILPQLRTDLIAEGQSLNHCVGGEEYYKKCMMGTYMIFFVRRQDAPEKPFFTMEMDTTNGRIIQLYGFGDCTAPKDVREFANAFSRFIQRKGVKQTA